MKDQVIVLCLIFFICIGCTSDNGSNDPGTPPDTLPEFDASDFNDPTTITNPWYGPPAGTVYVYEGGEIGADPEEIVRIERRTTTRVVMGVECIIHHDLVYDTDEVLIEDTDDWLAQDDAGNLWYFGETVKNYDEEGNYLDNEGSWEAGVDGALPGYWIPANPMVGQVYHQEWFAGEAEDYAEVIVLGETVEITLGIYENCLVTKDVNPFEEGVYELKYYAPGTGFIKEEKYEDGELVEFVELVGID
jgi:hypothetical protein